MKFKILFFFLFFYSIGYSQTYSRDGKGIKFLQLEGCQRTDNGNPCDSCFVLTNGVNGKLNRCLHISQLRSLLLGGAGSADSTYLVENGDGTYSLFNENGMEYPFGYKLDVSGDTIFLTDLSGNIADYILAADFDNQTLSWDSGTKTLGISNGNSVVLNGLGVDSVKLSLSGNTMESKVNTLSDTSLVIGTHEISFADSILYSEVNGVWDTANLLSLIDLVGGNGIYGGSDTIPDSTLAFLPTDHTFGIGSFTSWPSTNNSDLGIIWGGPYTGIQGLHFFGQQKAFPLQRYGSGFVTCDGIKWQVNDPSIPTASNILIGDESWSLSETNNSTGYSSSLGGSLGVGTWSSTIQNFIDADSIKLTSYTQLALDIAGNRGVDGQVLTAQGGYAIWADACCDTMGSGGGVDSVLLSISGNVMTSKVNTLSDTSLIIGELRTNLSGNVITTEVNNVTDTTLVIGNITTNLSGAVLTTSVNGVSDTANLASLLTTQTTNVLSYANPILTSTVNGVTDTALVSVAGVSDVDLDLSGNIMLSDVDGVNDTSLVIGNVTSSLSGTILTTSVNGVSDTAQLSGILTAGTTVLTQYNNEILTTTVNGVQDTAFIERDGNGIYGGDGQVPNSTYAYIPKIETFVMGYSISNPSITNTRDRAMYIGNNSIHLIVGDSIEQHWGELEMDQEHSDLSYNTGAITGMYYSSPDSTILSRFYAANNEGSRVKMTDDSLYIQSDMKIAILAEDSLNINIAGSYGANGQILTSDGSKATWQNPAAGVISSNTLSLSANTMTSSVNGVSDTSLVIGTHVISWDSTNKILTSSVNGVSDTTKITVASGSVSSNILTWDGSNILTSNVGGVSDTSFIYFVDSLKLNKKLEFGATFSLKDFNGSVGDADDILLNNGTGNPYWIDRDYKSVNTLSQITSDQDNYSSADNVLNISGDNGFRAITSLSSTNKVSGEIVTYNNVGSYPLYFPSNHPDASAANEIEYKEDIILMPKNSIQFMWLDNSSDDYWVPLTIPPVNGYNVYEFSAIPGSITAGDHGNIAFATSGGTSGTQGPISGTPLAAYSSATSTGATNSATVVLLKTVEEFCYASENHITGEWLVSIPTLSDATDSFDIYCHFLQNPAAGTANPNNSFGFRYSHGANGGEWYGFSKDNGGTTTTVDLNRAVTAGAINNLRLEMDKSKTEIRFYIDGNYAGRITANLPSSSSYAMRSAIFKGVGTTSRSLNTHRMSFRVVTP